MLPHVSLTRARMLAPSTLLLLQAPPVAPPTCEGQGHLPTDAQKFKREQGRVMSPVHAVLRACCPDSSVPAPHSTRSIAQGCEDTPFLFTVTRLSPPTHSEPCCGVCPLVCHPPLCAADRACCRYCTSTSVLLSMPSRPFPTPLTQAFTLVHHSQGKTRDP
jgi:hypothetical protein